jgi:hypothetical protein
VRWFLLPFLSFLLKLQILFQDSIIFGRKLAARLINLPCAMMRLCRSFLTHLRRLAQSPDTLIVLNYIPRNTESKTDLKNYPVLKQRSMAFSEQNGPDFNYTVEEVDQPSRFPDLLTVYSAQFRSFYIPIK